MASVAERPAIGQLLREWRRRRSVSQLQLATGSAVSARHLSFIETGRARPSREMVLYLAEQLDVPLRERNRMLLAAGYAPVFEERALDEADMDPVREALDRLLSAHEPYPAIVVDRHWNLVTANRAVELFTEAVAPPLLDRPANAYRIALHPEGLAPRIVNFREWSGHLLRRLHREALLSGDEELGRLYQEVSSYPGVDRGWQAAEVPTGADIVLSLRVRARGRELAFFSTVAVFGTALDVTLAELAIEAFYPADRETAAALSSLSGT